MGKLTIAKCKSITKPGMHGDGDTLFLRIAPGGSRQWVQRLTIHGKRRDLGLGGWPLLSLAEARVRAFENRKLARIDGGDPLAAKRKAKMPTFREAAEKTHKANGARWRNDQHEANWLRSLELHAFKVLGSTPVDRIGREDVLRVLTPLWGKRQDRAKRIRQRIRAVLAWAQAHNYVETNAADSGIDGALPVVRTDQTHYRALDYREVASALETVESTGASVSSKLCLRWVVLTACRSGEAREATWGEIDLEAREWRISADRMKGGREHRVPLSAAALEVLKQARALSGVGGWLFPSPMKPGRPLSNMTLTKLLRGSGLSERSTIHGFRSSFRDWCAEQANVPREVAEAALSHAVPGVEGAYFRSDLLSKRRALMAAWSAYLTGSAA